MTDKTSMITRTMTRDGSARLLFADTSVLVQRACEIHHTSKTMTAALGRSLTAASMMGCLLKDKGHTLTLRINGDGPAGSILCISDYCGNVKGWAENPDAELPPNAAGKLDVGGAVGKGTLSVMKNLGLAEPYIGMSDLVSGEIAEDVTEYYAVSEQTPTVCALGVRVNKDNSCRAAGGFLLQLMPNADESLIPILEQNIGSLGSISSLIADGVDAIGAIERIFSGIAYDLFDEISIAYQCSCSRDSYARALMSLGAEGLADLKKDGIPVEIRCRYCGKQHIFQLDEIQDMMEAVMRDGQSIEPEKGCMD